MRSTHQCLRNKIVLRGVARMSALASLAVCCVLLWWVARARRATEHLDSSTAAPRPLLIVPCPTPASPLAFPTFMAVRFTPPAMPAAKACSPSVTEQTISIDQQYLQLHSELMALNDAREMQAVRAHQATEEQLHAAQAQNAQLVGAMRDLQEQASRREARLAALRRRAEFAPPLVRRAFRFLANALRAWRRRARQLCRPARGLCPLSGRLSGRAAADPARAAPGARGPPKFYLYTRGPSGTRKRALFLV